MTLPKTDSFLRTTASVRDLNGIAQWLSRFGIMAGDFQRSRKPRTMDSLRAQRSLLADVSCSREIARATAYLKQYDELLQPFSEERLAYSRQLLSLDAAQALLVTEPAARHRGSGLG